MAKAVRTFLVNHLYDKFSLHKTLHLALIASELEETVSCNVILLFVVCDSFRTFEIAAGTGELLHVRSEILVADFGVFKNRCHF